MTGPHGIVIEWFTSRPHEEVLQETYRLDQFVKALTGFRSVMYYNIHQRIYIAVLAFTSESSTDDALSVLQTLLTTVPDKITLTKAQVIPGDEMEERKIAL
ncbi:hypothetical protein [Alicyclobacillus dauci]|uniref:Antibiotic biosynthesis monooxygenase n=1 Tax=Alicyclobacillus dauci TaxID=1475485 RepID=A0ABY6Z4N7_9BACL|nr:hypothetical protein [Alicyclobacillus dauci]WAH37627.1 hypothetical protein NZD86_03610 [Alicyclobacillus dauci]